MTDTFPLSRPKSSAFFGQGMTYSRARGRVGAYMRGSPDGMRPEPGRGAATIDDPYTDGVSITAWTPEGR